MFSNKEKGVTIYADLNHSVSTATLRTQDLIPVFLNVIKDTSEYRQFIQDIPSYVFISKDDVWWDEKGVEMLSELFDVLDSYAPEGYVFGSLPDDGADFGFWKTEEAILREPQHLVERLVLTRHENLEELKTKVASLLGMEVISIVEDDMSNLDDESPGFIQADFSMTLDINPNSDEFEYAMLTLFYYKDRQGNYVITETAFAFE